VLLVGSVALVAVSSAGANHIAGATYNGTLTGGSSLSFTVTSDGTGVSGMSAAGPIQGSTCTFSNVSVNYVTPLAITNHTFNDSSPPLTFSGSFPSNGTATGTFRINSAGCDTGNLAWNASTTPKPAAKCKGRSATIEGTKFSETLRGTNRKDVIDAGGGSDLVKAKGGNDIVCGGSGLDVLKGAGGRDKLFGEGGKDLLQGGGGKDRMVGGGGNDICIGGGGSDRAACELKGSI
jgi:Ca2+-binding RTX toxin-like protein